MERLYPALLFGWFLFGIAANVDSSTIEERIQGEISFISGGIGSEEREALKHVRSDYNLSLLFAMQGSGEYLSDIAVTVEDGKRHTVLDIISEGPILFTKLKPGRYRVSADHNGHTISKSVVVSGKHRSPLSFYWPDQQAELPASAAN